MQADIILSEIEGTVNKITKDYFIDFLNTEGTGQKENYLFYYDFITDNIPNDLIYKLLGLDSEYYYTIDEIIRHKALESYKEPTREDIVYYNVFYEDIQPDTENKKELQKLNPQKLKEVFLMTDKVNNKIWNTKGLFERYGTIPEEIKTSSKKENAVIIVNPNFEEVGASLNKELTYFDKRVYTIAASVFSTGKDIITVSQICKECGFSEKPNQSQLEKVNKSLNKMMFTRVYIDNKKEVEAGLKYPKFEYDAPLLPFERIKTSVRGKTVTSIRILEEPPLARFARIRRQFTTIPGDIYKTPLPKTENNLQLEDYLTRHIARIKNNRLISDKLLFSTICKIFNIPEDRRHRVQRSRLFNSIITLLKDYKQKGYIQDYSTDSNKNITFILSERVERLEDQEQTQ